VLPITVVTGNKGKAAEIERILGFKFNAVELDLPEIQSMDVRAVAAAKAKAAYDLIKAPVMVDDTSLYIEHLGGLPGPFVAWFMSALGDGGLAKLMAVAENRKAKVGCCIGYVDGQGQVHTFLGEVEGTITTNPRGTSAKGLGFDSIFIPTGATQTFAEMTGEEKDVFSHRCKALELLKVFLEQNPKGV
jgi:XTP/dITP diphosphohydrolase